MNGMAKTLFKSKSEVDSSQTINLLNSWWKKKKKKSFSRDKNITNVLKQNGGGE